MLRYAEPMAWDLWVDFMRTDDAGLTHASLRDLADGRALKVGAHLVVGNEDADPAVARIERIDGQVVLVRVLPGPVDANRGLLASEVPSASNL